MIIVTGGAGFIGSNIVAALNKKGHDNILVVDDLTDGRKFKNIVDLHIADYLDKDDFINQLEYLTSRYGHIDAIFHEGACSSTTEWDGRMMMKVNYEYSKRLLEFAQQFEIPFFYASSGATYGTSTIFKETPEYEKPLNVYGYSKLLFDQYVRRILPKKTSQIVGFRYFNVYGPREFHKGSMASVAYHNYLQLQDHDEVKLFEGCDSYGPGEQRRDFVFVEDVCAVNLWFMEHPEKSGIFNVGTGRSQMFKEVSESVINRYGRGHITYIPFPDHLKGRYQSYTQADISLLRQAGYEAPFKTVQEGVKCYLDWLGNFEI